MIFFTVPAAPRRMEPEEAARLYRQYADMIYRIAFVRTLSQSDAEDVLQEVFCRCIRRRPVFEDEGHCRAWFIRAAVNCSTTLLTSAWRRRTVTGGEESLPDTEDLTARMERDTEVYHAVMQLPREQRTVVHLYYYEDCTVEKIAQLTASTQSAVKSRLFRARETLRGILKEDIDV